MFWLLVIHLCIVSYHWHFQNILWQFWYNCKLRETPVKYIICIDLPFEFPVLHVSGQHSPWNQHRRGNIHIASTFTVDVAIEIKQIHFRHILRLCRNYCILKSLHYSDDAHKQWYTCCCHLFQVNFCFWFRFHRYERQYLHLLSLTSIYVYAPFKKSTEYLDAYKMYKYKASV